MFYLLVYLPLVCFSLPSSQEWENRDLNEVFDYPDLNLDDLPTNYNAREDPAYDVRCQKVLNEVPRQSLRCGHCFGMAGALSFSQRYCRLTEGAFSHSLSATQITQCSSTGIGMPDGCSGGLHSRACQPLFEYGIVSGSTEFNDQTGCLPYIYPYCDPKNPEQTCPCPLNGNFAAGTCMGTQCKDGRQAGVGEVTSKGTCQYLNPSKDFIKRGMAEIMTNGAVMAYVCGEPLSNYKSGIIKENVIPCTNNHAVTIYGWGTKFSVTHGNRMFWRVMNSWGRNWGEDGGFRIYAGQNLYLIESGWAFAVFNRQLPEEVRLFRRLEVENQLMDCFSLGKGKECTRGRRRVSVASALIDYGCFKRDSEMAKLLHRYPMKKPQNSHGYVALSRREIIPLTCTVLK